MLSFHNDINIKNQLISNIVDFGGKIDDYSEHERVFGIPTVIARLQCSISESLPVDESKWWSVAFAEAAPVGVDLSMVWPRFAIWMLGDPNDGVIQYVPENQRAPIKNVISLYTRVLTEKNVTADEWRTAFSTNASAGATLSLSLSFFADATYYAAFSADEAAAAAVYAYASAEAAACAAGAAKAAIAEACADATEERNVRKKQALKLIEILKSEKPKG